MSIYAHFRQTRYVYFHEIMRSGLSNNCSARIALKCYYLFVYVRNELNSFTESLENHRVRFESLCFTSLQDIKMKLVSPWWPYGRNEHNSCSEFLKNHNTWVKRPQLQLRCGKVGISNVIQFIIFLILFHQPDKIQINVNISEYQRDAFIAS